jgi:two-component system, chemotaxis family, protein-glutamate methylesterase/glutaminase
MSAGRPIRVLVIDDSALIRKMLSELIASDPAFEVVGTAVDPFDAREKIKKLAPDVLTLDVEMPRMDGLTFLANLMRLKPMPVVMVSTLTQVGADATLEALELGAVDFISKPTLDVRNALAGYVDELHQKLEAAAAARVLARDSRQRRAAKEGAEPVKLAGPETAPRRLLTTDKLIAIGASTGGVEALRHVLVEFPATTPAILVVQHIPAGFSTSFARRLDTLCPMRVHEAADGQPVLPGNIYIAPGSHHLRIVREGARYFCRLGDDEPVNRHRPSVDVLFESVLRHAGTNACAGILTGMGNDGARGLRALRDAGCHTLAQDEATSVVWGMPGEAVGLGAAERVVPLADVSRNLLAFVADLQSVSSLEAASR